MGKVSNFKRIILAAGLSVLSLQVMADLSDAEQQADKNIAQLYHSLDNMPTADMHARIENISQQFLGKPYLLGALGEGAKGQYDQFPLYRTDAFDCETFVDTVLAMALASEPTTFKQCIRHVRYQNGDVSFINRNHFTCLDWNQNNQRQGFIKDITTTFIDQQKRPVAKTATALINKPGWYQHFTLTNLRLNSLSNKERAARLEALQREGNQLKQVESSIPYIPLTALFDSSGNANDYLFKQIPNASIIEIIRPNWNLQEQIGTNLNVSHLGFAVWVKGTLMFREASSAEGKTVDVPLVEYLRKVQSSPTIKGINVQVVLPQQPLQQSCSDNQQVNK